MFKAMAREAAPILIGIKIKVPAVQYTRFVHVYIAYVLFIWAYNSINAC